MHSKLHIMYTVYKRWLASQSGDEVPLTTDLTYHQYLEDMERRVKCPRNIKRFLVYIIENV